MSDLDEFRREVAAVHGLPAAAATFISGSTVEEIEASARSLAEVLGAGGAKPEPEPVKPLADVFSNAARRKHEQQRELIVLLHGPRSQRDERGRFARSTGFDGGARTPAPTPVDPYAAHGELVVSLAARAQLGAGGW